MMSNVLTKVHFKGTINLARRHDADHASLAMTNQLLMKYTTTQRPCNGTLITIDKCWIGLS